MASTNSEEVRIRSVDPSDIADLIRLGEVGNLSPWTAEHYLAEMKNPDAILLRLVADDNATRGFVVGRIVIGGSIEKTQDAEIYNIMVDETVRGCGLGQKLFDCFIDRCRIRDVVNVWLEVRESNRSAISFYLKNGFSHVHTRRRFYRDPVEHALLMKLTLT